PGLPSPGDSVCVPGRGLFSKYRRPLYAGGRDMSLFNVLRGLCRRSTTPGRSSSRLPGGNRWTRQWVMERLEGSMVLSYAFSLIADNSDSSPFSSFSGSPAINNAGTVAFHALLTRGGEGTYTSSDGSYTTIANTNGPFSSLGTPAIDPGGT